VRLGTLAHHRARSATVPSMEPPPVEPGDSGGHRAEDRTGVPAADAALDQLDTLSEEPLERHVEIFDDVQRRLHEGLADLDEGG
jgi:hypothetical protein